MKKNNMQKEIFDQQDGNGIIADVMLPCEAFDFEVKGAAVKILIACEESQTVCKAFRKRGFEAYSCDILPCSGGHPEWHIQGDVLQEMANTEYDCVIAFPPCTHLAVSGAKHFEQKRKDGRQRQGINFFMEFFREERNFKFLAVENPIGIMSSEFRKPDQIIQPWQFGDKAQKTTCLWLKGLPLLKPTNIVDKGEFYISPSGKKLPKWYGDASDENGKKIGYNTALMKQIRSKTFQGIADAMAYQWGNWLLKAVAPLTSKSNGA